jgi:hypothetical protein
MASYELLDGILDSLAEGQVALKKWSKRIGNEKRPIVDRTDQLPDGLKSRLGNKRQKEDAGVCRGCGANGYRNSMFSTSAPSAPTESQMLPDRPSRKVFEFLNDNLIAFLERILVTGDRVKHELEELLSRIWYS